MQIELLLLIPFLITINVAIVYFGAKRLPSDAELRLREDLEDLRRKLDAMTTSTQAAAPLAKSRSPSGRSARATKVATAA